MIAVDERAWTAVGRQIIAEYGLPADTTIEFVEHYTFITCILTVPSEDHLPHPLYCQVRIARRELQNAIDPLSVIHEAIRRAAAHLRHAINESVHEEFIVRRFA